MFLNSFYSWRRLSYLNNAAGEQCRAIKVDNIFYRKTSSSVSLNIFRKIVFDIEIVFIHFLRALLILLSFLVSVVLKNYI